MNVPTKRITVTLPTLGWVSWGTYSTERHASTLLELNQVLGTLVGFRKQHFCLARCTQIRIGTLEHWSTHRFVSLFLSNMNSPFINVHAAYDVEKIVRNSHPAIFDNLWASWLSDLVFVWVQHIHALNAQDIPQNTVRIESKQKRTKSNILRTKPL